MGILSLKVPIVRYVMTNKKDRGQFYTTHHEYILDGFEKPHGKVVEPFAGRGDLLNWVGHDNFIAFDIEPKRDDIIKRDTLLDPPNYKDAFIITNPPYLARNKCTSKTVYDRYEMNDLYKCFIMSLIQQEGGCEGGIFIIPVGFFLSPRPKDVTCRNAFLSKYKITKIKYFEESVFQDTPTTVVAFSFIKSDCTLDSQEIEWEQRPSGECKRFILDKRNNWIVGGDIYNLKMRPDIKVYRFVRDQSIENITHLTLNALDSGLKDGRIRLSFKKNHVYRGQHTSRSYATLCIQGLHLSDDDQMKLANDFNQYIETKRYETWSLFLPQYRESKEYARKRMPFDLAYRVISNLLLSTDV